jgi:antitoxin Phd
MYIEVNIDMNTWSLQNAKARFSELVNVCRENGPQMVTRHGRDTVVVISAEEYRRRFAQRTNLKDFLLSAPRVDLSIERPKDTGREVNL